MIGNTVDALCERVRRDALLSLRGPVYTLANSVTANATSLTLNENPGNVATGSVVAVDAELYFVKEVAEAAKRLDVIPGYHGSTSASHNADAIVEVDSRIPKASLIDYAQQEITSWGSQLWRIVEATVSVTRAKRTYEIPNATDIHFLLDVRAEPIGLSGWAGDSWAHLESRLLTDVPLAEFPSGSAVQLNRNPTVDTDATVVYAAPFDTSTFTLNTNLVTNVGLLPNHLDVLEWGVRWRALSSGLVARTDWRSAGMARNAEEVSVLDVIRATDMARAMRDRRLADESLELRRRYPYRRGN